MIKSNEIFLIFATSRRQKIKHSFLCREQATQLCAKSVGPLYLLDNHEHSFHAISYEACYALFDGANSNVKYGMHNVLRMSHAICYGACNGFFLRMLCVLTPKAKILLSLNLAQAALAAFPEAQGQESGSRGKTLETPSDSVISIRIFDSMI